MGSAVLYESWGIFGINIFGIILEKYGIINDKAY